MTITSFYDSAVRWYENIPQYYKNVNDPEDPRNGEIEDIYFEEHLISDGVDEAQASCNELCFMCLFSTLCGNYNAWDDQLSCRPTLTLINFDTGCNSC